ncbi:MAG: DUF1492 domain-containing protein [Clostridia bacterium]|nr:DUF1492 domain-containing protein [Clostridia bacterium]
MTKKEDTSISEARRFLESYKVNKKLLSMLKYEKDYFSDESDCDSLGLPFGGDEVLLRSRMLEVRRFISNIEDGNCRLLLFYHYIKGFSVEKCAEMMNIGRTSGFRIKKRALAIASEKIHIQRKKVFSAA